jgi:hypothetical protein
MVALWDGDLFHGNRTQGDFTSGVSLRLSLSFEVLYRVNRGERVFTGNTSAEEIKVKWSG